MATCNEGGNLKATYVHIPIFLFCNKSETYESEYKVGICSSRVLYDKNIYLQTLPGSASALPTTSYRTDPSTNFSSLCSRSVSDTFSSSSASL